MEEILLVVNENDEVIGRETREKCHAGEGLLHRAITVFLFNNKGELLITQRSAFKTLWPGGWDTSCSTHVYEGETSVQAGERRLLQELGITSTLKHLLTFHYQVRFNERSSENEMCALLVGAYDGVVSPNAQEVSGYRWIDINHPPIRANRRMDFQGSNEDDHGYTPWLKIALQKYLEYSTT